MPEIVHGESVRDLPEWLQTEMPWAATEEPFEVMERMYVMGGTGE
jgi:hypothetical protein